MSSAAPAYPLPAYGVLRIPAAAFEILLYLAVVAIATLCFLAGWLPVNGAVVLTVVLLTSLIVLSWAHLGQGRHPCFLFLCTLMFFQGGRLLAYCLGGEPDPMRVRLMAVDPFSIGSVYEGVVLLCVSLSAICIYAPSRWDYVSLPPPDTAAVLRYLPCLYLLFALTFPAQLVKNYSYYHYVQQHGGYFAIYQNYAGLAASTPLLVRALALVTLPVFVAIFVFEPRKRFVVLITVLYFGAASLTLLMGARLFFFALVFTLWYVARLKSTKPSRILLLAAAVFALALLAQGIQNYREDAENSEVTSDNLVQFLAMEGSSIDVTEVAVKWRQLFDGYADSYLLNELQDAYSANDVRNYARGKSLDYDVSVFLNPIAFGLGGGVGSSYIGEAYVIGGVGGVIVISLLAGLVLHRMHRYSQKPMALLIVALTMPVVLYMPRGNLLGWLATFARSFLLLLLLGVAWQMFALLSSIRQSLAVGGDNHDSARRVDVGL
jgi:oligosaccharide repeat unit polymerase